MLWLMNRLPLNSDLAGFELEPSPVSWDSKDTILYALGVGAKPEGELEFIYEGKGPKVLPTYGVIPVFGAMGSIFGQIDVNPAMILHGEQYLEVHRPIPPNTKAEVRGRIANVWDKQKAAVIEIDLDLVDDDGPISRARYVLFARGAGGFGGESGPSAKGKNAPPDREPDHIWQDSVLPEQAAIYRLSGDLNPLHIDPDFAKMVGFETPFIHGLCTYGFTARAVIDKLCGGAPEKFKSLEGRFSKQVYPGDTIIVKIWDEDNGESLIQVETQIGDVVLSQAKAVCE